MEDNKKKELIVIILKVLAAALAVISLLLSSGCGSSEKSEVEGVVPKAGMVQLYHPTEDSVEPDEEAYQLMQPDNLAASVEEVLEKLHINQKLVVDKYTIDINDGKKIVTLFISETAELSEEELLLNKAAIVKSVKGIGVDEVGITLNSSDGKKIDKATYSDASFFYYDK